MAHFGVSVEVKRRSCGPYPPVVRELYNEWVGEREGEGQEGRLGEKVERRQVTCVCNAISLHLEVLHIHVYIFSACACTHVHYMSGVYYISARSVWIVHH